MSAKGCIKFILILSCLAGCTRSTNPAGESTTKSVILHNNASGDKLVFSLNQTVVLRQCRPGELATQVCTLATSDVVMALQNYIQALAGQFSVDYDLVGLGSAERLTQEIKDTQTAISSGTLSPDESLKANEYLQRLQANQTKLDHVFAIVSHLADGQDITFNANFSDDFTKILAPFDAVRPEPVTNFTADPDTGLAWISLGNRCWYDANDLQRGVPCHGPVAKGCRLTYGTQWGLPTTAQVQATQLHGFFLDEMTEALTDDWGGLLMNDGSILCNNYSTGHQLGTCNRSSPFGDSSQFMQNGWAMCVAPVREIDPEGDVDNDGVINRIDLCNRRPADRTTPVHHDGPWIGCAGGQIKD